MSLEVGSIFFPSTVAAIILCSQVADCNDGSDNLFFDNKRRHIATVQDDVDEYLIALQKFDRSDDCLARLTASIKNFFKHVGLRMDEISAPLYSFPLLRRDIFPDLQYRRIYRDSWGGFLLGRLDILIHRIDGTLFVINTFRDPVPTLKLIEEKGKGGNKTYKGVKRPISHVIAVTLNWSQAKDVGHNRTLIATFQCDNFNNDTNVVTVEI